MRYITLILFLSFFIFASSVFGENASVELNPNNVDVDMGTEFYLNLDIKNIPSNRQCAGFETTIQYNKSLLDLTDIQLSDIANAANLKYTNVSEGVIRLVWFSNCPTGNFTIATLKFKPKSDGNGEVLLNRAVISDNSGTKYSNLKVYNANISINALNQTVGRVILDDFAYNKNIDAIIHIDGAKTPIYNISGNITFNNVILKGNPVILAPFNTSILTTPNTNTVGFYIVPKNSSKYIDLLKIPIDIPNPNYNITLNLFVNGKKITNTYVEVPVANISKYGGFITDDSSGNIVESLNITYGTSKTVKLKVFNIDNNITQIIGNIFVNNSIFKIKNYKIPTYSNIHDKVNYSNISLNESYLFFNISLSNATNGSFSIIEFKLYPNLNKNISSKIYVSNFTLYANKTPIVLTTKSLNVQIVKRNNNTPPMGKIGISVRNNNAVDFYALSYDPDDEELDYYWDFGDGTNSTQKNPTHTYKNYSDYLVKLTTNDSLGATTITCGVISLHDYHPLKYTFSRKNFTENENNKTTYMNITVTNPLIWKTHSYINFEEYKDINLTKTQYAFELNPNESKTLIIPISIKKTSNIKWNLVFYPEIKNKYAKNNPIQLSYYLWDYNEKIEVKSLPTVKVNEITKYINLNATNIVVKINKKKVSKNYVINKTIKLDILEKRDIIYYYIVSIMGFIIGMILIRIK